MPIRPAPCCSSARRRASRGCRAAPPGTARLVRYTNTEVIVEVTAPLDEILVLNDIWHPWWRATVDGVATEILKANVIFRAVLVPRGHHTVRFTFHPFSGALTELIGKMRGAAR